MKPEGMNYKD